jgi:transcriptional regulator with XRE-family HTH domain
MKNIPKTETFQLLGSKVKQRRNELTLSQESLASICGFDRTYISLIERGKRNISFTNLLTLSEGLQTSISELTRDI